ncbi:MAG: hypothetical protein V1901_03700 [Patescibacteria group bacterium]
MAGNISPWQIDYKTKKISVEFKTETVEIDSYYKTIPTFGIFDEILKVFLVEKNDL